jgi:hypothetical protein
MSPMSAQRLISLWPPRFTAFATTASPGTRTASDVLRSPWDCRPFPVPVVSDKVALEEAK